MEVILGQEKSSQVSCVLLISVCSGTNSGPNVMNLAEPDKTVEHRLQQYRKIYSNCTYVEGNLEIVFLSSTDDTTHDLDFLRNIQEV